MAGDKIHGVKILRALAATLFSTLLCMTHAPASAGEAKTVCTLGELDREIEIATPGREGLSRICEVYYLKEYEGVASHVIWHAHKTLHFCAERASELLAKLENAGWSCRITTNSNEAETNLSESDPTSLDVNEGTTQIASTPSAATNNTAVSVDANQSLFSASALYTEGTTKEKKRAGHGDISISYQSQRTSGIELKDLGFVDVGVTNQHAVIFEIDYWLTDNVRINAGIPYITKRYKGDFPHDPSVIIPAVDAPFIDDGRYRGDIQDVYFGMAYRVLDGPIKVEPFVNVSIPVTDYPFFASAAIGQHLKRLEIGSSFAYVPPLDDYYVNLSASYNIVERTLSYNVDHMRLSLDVGYFLTRNFSVRGLVMAKQGNGIAVIDFPDFTSRLWYRHDQLLRHNYINIGAGLSWAIDSKNAVSVTALRTVRAVDLFPMKYGIGVSFIRSF